MRVSLPDGALAGADPIFEILKNYKTIAVVGLSSNPARPSHGVTEYMKAAGFRIIPVNPNEKEVLGEKSYARLEDVPEKIEIVNVFRRWMQLGIENEAAAEKARGAGLMVIEDACLLVEHRKRLQKLRF